MGDVESTQFHETDSLGFALQLFVAPGSLAFSVHPPLIRYPLPLTTPTLHGRSRELVHLVSLVHFVYLIR